MTLDHLDPEEPQPVNAVKSAVHRLAEQFAEKVGFLPGDSIESLVERLGGTVHYLGAHDSFFENDGSLTVWGPRNFEIRISGLTGAERDRFTIAHEIGHYILHSRAGKKRIRAARCGSSRVEWEANWFASALLMPEADFRNTCLMYGADTSRVAARYLVSPKAAEIRMKALGILSNDDG